MKKVLLSSFLRPLGTDHGDPIGVSAELLDGQITVAQGAFTPRTSMPHFALDYMAHNLDAPTVVLQYPTEKEFIKELKHGGYDYVGISFNMCTFHKMRRMSELVRKYSPKSKIVVGGYGTLVEDELLLPYADHICRTEGIAYMRELLGEPPKKIPYDQPYTTITMKLCHIPVAKNAIIFGSLGCPNGCEFCSTSALFKSKSIRLLPKPEDVYRLVERARDRNPDGVATIFCEEFLQDPEWSRGYLKLVRESGKTPYPLVVLSSIRSVAKFDPQELIEMGIDVLWFGYEGKRSGFAKQKVDDVQAIVANLRAHGIKVLASYIMGFDYQTKQDVRDEVQELIDMKLPFYQFLIYGAAPGTPFWKRAVKKDIFLPNITKDMHEYLWKCTGFYGLMKHPTLSPEELQKLQMECYTKEFTELGPSMLRAVETMVLALKTLKDNPSPTTQLVLERYRRDILQTAPLFLAGKLFAPSKKARERVEKVYQETKEEVGLTNTPAYIAQSATLAGMFVAATVFKKLKWFQQPIPMRNCYRNPDEKSSILRRVRERTSLLLSGPQVTTDRAVHAFEPSSQPQTGVGRCSQV